MANYVSQIKANNTTYDVRELYPHVGTCSDAAGTAAKTVTIGNFKLYTGAWVVVKFANTNSAAVASLTLNIDGTGAKPIKYRNANLGSAGQLVANRYTMFIYDGTNYQYVGDINSNDNTYDRNRYNANIKAGSNALVAGNIIVGKDGVYNHLKSGAAFDVSYPILYNNGAVAAGATTTNTYDILHFTVTTTQSITLTAYLPVYIKGTLAGKIFTPIGTSPLTQIIPTTADGYHYIYLGTATGTTTVYLQEMHPIYAYMNGAFGLAAVNATYASTAGAVAWSGVTSTPTTISGYGITDAKIANGTITLGSNTITPLTSHQTITTGSANGTISVAGTDVAVKGLGTAAYKAESDFAVSRTLASNVNLDSITTPGFYNCGGSNSVYNKPSGVDAFGLEVIHDASGSWYTQILYANADNPKSYRRNYNSSTWSAWTEDKLTDNDTKNTAGSTDTSSKIFLIGATSQAANPQTYSDNEVFTTSGVLTTKKVQVGGGSCTMQYNTTTQSLDFVFT